jgi:hypothetical protein
MPNMAIFIGEVGKVVKAGAVYYCEHCEICLAKTNTDIYPGQGLKIEGSNFQIGTPRCMGCGNAVHIRNMHRWTEAA